MSLRGKILLLFLSLAVGPFAAVAAFAYVQSTRAVRSLVQGNADVQTARAAGAIAELARRVKDQVSRTAEYPGVRTLLGSTATSRGSFGGDDGDPAGPLPIEAVFPYEILASLSGLVASLEVRARDGTIVARGHLAGEAVDLGGCPPGHTPASGPTLSRPVTAPSGDDVLGSVTASLRPEGILAGRTWEAGGARNVRTLVVDRNAGVVLSDRCDELGMSLTALANGRGWSTDLAVLAAEHGRFEYRDDEGMHLASFVGLDVPPWTVVSTASMAVVTAPIHRMRLDYGLFVLFVVAATGAAFSLLIGRVIRSLADVTEAAMRIGEGDLTPWLPPPGEDEVGRLSFAIGRMVDRLKGMMRQVERSGRLAAVGELSSHLAHEVRNPLSSIKLNLQGLRREVDSGLVLSDASESIQISLREVERLERVVSGVLALGRTKLLARQSCSVHGLLREIVTFVRTDLDRRGLELTLDLRASEDTVLADSSEIKSVLMNLLLNAADAMPDGGPLAVWTDVVMTREGERVVEIHVLDWGPGVPPEFRDRIFEPFFTTKTEGSGIGLALALQCVRQHGGELYLEQGSELSRGSEFVVRLPLDYVESEEDPGSPTEDGGALEGDGSLGPMASARGDESHPGSSDEAQPTGKRPRRNPVVSGAGAWKAGE